MCIFYCITCSCGGRSVWSSCPKIFIKSEQNVINKVRNRRMRASRFTIVYVDCDLLHRRCVGGTSQKIHLMCAVTSCAQNWRKG